MVVTIFYVLIVLPLHFSSAIFLGGFAGSIKRVLAFETSQRNRSAALAISALNFTDPELYLQGEGDMQKNSL
ncbi:MULTISPECIES: hypothetical protein [unclassified Methanosarcina]|uniref:hypothetical protein n=1 Tax=unclassified Methanosarcina TaxID=2644672 RepID=UPI0018CFBA80|nr:MULTISPECIES: hypothetical protein [unclassified Methanosarcina]